MSRGSTLMLTITWQQTDAFAGGRSFLTDVAEMTRIDAIGARAKSADKLAMQSEEMETDTSMCTENLNPGIMVMESAEDGNRFNASGPLNRTSYRADFPLWRPLRNPAPWPALGRASTSWHRRVFSGAFPCGHGSGFP